MSARKGANSESRTRKEHHLSLDRLEDAMNERDHPYDEAQAGRIVDASRREKRARESHDQAIVAKRQSRQAEANERD